MEKVNAILEKYTGSYRVTPERPTRKRSKDAPEFQKIKAEIIHWQESDAMDIFVVPPRNPSAATTRVVKSFSWGSVSRSIYGSYRISLAALDREGKPYTIKEISAHAAEAQRWINEDKAAFVAQPKAMKGHKK